MKHLNYFKTFEAIIMPNDITIDEELKSFDDFVDWGKENNVDVVKYEEFYDSLDDENKKTAPPEDSYNHPFFALFHPIRKKPMFVVSDEKVFKHLPMNEIIADIIGHEIIHQKQDDKRGDLEIVLPNPEIKKDYFSNKDEIMAFSWTIANDISKISDSFEEAIDKFKKNKLATPGVVRLANEIINNVDEEVKKRYNKYIYLYLKEIFRENKSKES